MIQLDRPFDLLTSLRGHKVIISCKGYKEYDIEGKLHTFDLNLNLVIEIFENGKPSLQFIKGDTVLNIREKI